MQKAIERVECDDEERKKNSKSNPRYDDLLNADFLWNRYTPNLKTNPEVLSFSLSNQF